MNYKELIEKKKSLQAQKQILIHNYIDSDNLFDKLQYDIAYDEVVFKIKQVNRRIELLKSQTLWLTDVTFRKYK